MNYKKIYNSIIAKAKLENRIKHNGIYYENHHILPISLKGENKKDNLVLLTAKEHFICHKLLLHIYLFNKSIIHAFHRMCHSGKGDYVTSARDFEYARILLSEVLKESMKGKGNPMYGKKLSEETKRKIGIKSKGRNHTEESKEKMSLSKIGDKNPMYGKPGYFAGLTRSEETKRKISLSVKNIRKKECKYCHMFVAPCNYNRHINKCKLKLYHEID